MPDVALLGARRFGAPLVVVSQDVFPEIAVELKRLENRVVIQLLRRPIAGYLERADRFVVMHSGNVGYAQNLDALVRAATFLRDLDRLAIAIVGEGSRREELMRLAELLETEQVSFLPYQPRLVLPQSLSAADVHVVGLARGLSGYVVPSRLYGIMSVGRPVIVAADPTSETAQLVERVGCGIVVAPGRPELVARAIRRAHDGELELEEMGRRAREYVAAEADRDVAVGRYPHLPPQP